MKLTKQQIRMLFYRYLYYRQQGKPYTVYQAYNVVSTQNTKAWFEIVEDAECKQSHEPIYVLVISRRSFVCGYIYFENGSYFFRILNKIECYDIPLNYNEIKNEYTLRGDFYDNI